MLQQNLSANENQHQSPHKLRLGLILAAKDIPHLHPDDGEAEGDDADEGDGGKDGHRQEGKGDAHRQGVDAGGDGKEHHGGKV